ncbi:MAG: DUF3000 domain-containing protein [Actinobacteria bacterium]|nr:DUF3000 domain-containing protein [Actinomycetota bacterium]NCA25814.1 DUF3000 domain-containing protein [Actinomycetota bacterium]NCU78273.1 DUF3000 domain-containing protein [Actinomycetota bacterium]NCZ76619.1 DUF3000 domain-containing protein [Actinomycetota bacterium]
MTSNFEQLVAPILALKPRSEILLEIVPAPQKLAPHAIALTADVLEDAATGRLVLLHDPNGQDGWAGQWRFVTFTRAAIDVEMASDPLLPEIGWAWLMESLKKFGCEYVAASGTVTRVASASFGDLEDKDEDSEIEIRASWTPTNQSQLVNNVNAWLELLGMTAGLEPIPEGVSSISRKI